MEFMFLETKKGMRESVHSLQMCAESSCVLVNGVGRQGLGLKSAHAPGDRKVGTPMIAI